MALYYKYALYFSHPNPRGNEPTAEIEAKPNDSYGTYYVFVSSGSNLNTMTASCEVSAATSSASATFNYNGSAVTYGSVKKLQFNRNQEGGNAKFAYAAEGMAAATAASKTGNVAQGGSFLIKRMDDPDQPIVYTTIAKDWVNYDEHWGQTTDEDKLFRDPQKHGDLSLKGGKVNAPPGSPL